MNNYFFNIIPIGLYTLVHKECARFLRIWPQTLIPPVVTTALYFVIFGQVIGQHVPDMQGYSYLEFIVPGLILMAALNNSYSNVVSSFFGSKFQRHIEELLVSPMPIRHIMIGYIAGGTLRGLLIASVVLLVSLLFAPINIMNPLLMLLLAILTGILFSILGLINAIFAQKFDDITIVPNFVLLPLTYLGGVFYSIDRLPGIWQDISYFNPIVYLISAFRYSMLGFSDISVSISLILIGVFITIAYSIAWFLLTTGVKLKQ